MRIIRDHHVRRHWSIVIMIMGSVGLLECWIRVKCRGNLLTDLNIIRICLISRLSFFNPGLRMVRLRRYPSWRGLIYFPIIMWKVMHGIIGFMFLMIRRDWLNYSGDKRSLLNNWINYFPKVWYGQLFGYQILTIGQEINMIYSQCGCLA